MKRTHETLLPAGYRKSLDKLPHHENVGDHALVISKGQATDGCEDGACEGKVVVSEASEAFRTVCVCVGYAIWVDGQCAAMWGRVVCLRGEEVVGGLGRV